MIMDLKRYHKPVLVLTGPTAIGKTNLSLKLAEQFHCEIVSVDSMQIYRYMDIGTAKASTEERKQVPHHLIDIVDPDEPYDAVRFARDAKHAITNIHKQNKIPLLTGGTGLYLKAVFHGIFPGVVGNKDVRNDLDIRIDRLGPSKLHEELSVCDPVSAVRIHPNDAQRIVRALEVYLTTGKALSAHIEEHNAKTRENGYENNLQIGLTTQRDLLYSRINKRCRIMIEAGLETEVRDLLEMGYSDKLNPMNSIGYKHMINYINGSWSKDKMIEILSRDTRRYAKRQYTWFNKNARMEWFKIDDQKQIVEKVKSWVGNHKAGDTKC